MLQEIQKRVACLERTYELWRALYETGDQNSRCLAIGKRFLRSDTATVDTLPVTAPVLSDDRSVSLSKVLPGATVPGLQNAMAGRIELHQSRVR